MPESLHLVCPHCAAVNRVFAEKLKDSPICGQCKQALFNGEPLEVDANTFDRHIGRNGLPVIVDFWAAWCGPCQMMAPNFHQAAIDLEPYARFLKVDTERQQQLAGRFNIRSIPTLAIFRNGREITRHSGAIDAATLERWVRAQL